jgi:hypothetical protein
MAVKIRSAFGARTPSQIRSASIAPPSDLGLGSLAQSLGAVANRAQNTAERERAELEQDRKYEKRVADSEAKQKSEKAKSEADTLAIMGAQQSFNEFGTQAFMDDEKQGLVSNGKYLEEYAARLDSQIAAKLEELPEDIRSRAAIELKAARGQLLSSNGRIANQLRASDEMAKAGNTIDAIASRILVKPTDLPNGLADAKKLIDAMPLSPAAKEAAYEDAKAKISEASLMGRIEHNPAAVLKDIKDGKFEGFIDSARLSSLMNAADAQVQQLRREAEARAAQARALAEQRRHNAEVEARQRQQQARQNAAIAEQAFRERNLPGVQMALQSNIQSLTITGKYVANAPSDDTIRRVVGETGLSVYKQQVGMAQKVWSATGDMAALTPAQINMKINTLRPRGGEANYSELAQVHQYAVNQAQQTLQQRRNDPAGYWLGTSVFTDAMNDLKRSQPRLSDAQRQNLILPILQQRYGGAQDGRVRLVPIATAKEWGQQIASSPQTAVQRLAQIKEVYGRNTGAALADIAEASGNPGVRIMANIPANNQSRAVELLFAGPPKTRFNTRQQNAIRSEVQSKMRPLLDSLASSGATRGMNEAYFESGTKMVMQLMDQGYGQANAVQEVTGLLRGNYRFSHGIRFPEDTGNVSMLAGTAFSVKSAIIADPSSLAPRGGVPNQTPEQRQKAYAAEIRRNSRWITLTDDSGILLIDAAGRPVMDVNNRPIVRTWQQLNPSYRGQ